MAIYYKNHRPIVGWRTHHSIAQHVFSLYGRPRQTPGSYSHVDGEAYLGEATGLMSVVLIAYAVNSATIDPSSFQIFLSGRIHGKAHLKQPWVEGGGPAAQPDAGLARVQKVEE